MDFPPERQVEFFAVRYYDVERKKWFVTRWKMQLEEAAERFGSMPHEILQHTREVRTLGGDPQRMSTSSFMRKRD